MSDLASLVDTPLLSSAVAVKARTLIALPSISKQQIIDLLDGKEGFAAITQRRPSYVTQSRQDYVAFQWSDKPDRSDPVLVEIFCEQFAGSQYTMRDVQPTVHAVNGQKLGSGLSSFLDPF
ncbi:hypothetical protein VTN96DRAFT_8937 [Rasamsonia emersonii]